MTWEAARRWALKFYRYDGLRRRVYGERTVTGWAFRVALTDQPAPTRKAEVALCGRPIYDCRCDGSAL